MRLQQLQESLERAGGLSHGKDYVPFGSGPSHGGYPPPEVCSREAAKRADKTAAEPPVVHSNHYLIIL